VNERGALNNGRFSFTHKYTLVSELLQNARRAGATEVHVDYDEKAQTLTVADNGRGIEDFQKLLTLNESGWDAQLVATENAFGIGFSKVLYSARRCIVTSRGKRLDFDTRQALEQTPLDVVDDPLADPATTVVQLQGVDLGDLAERIARLVCGFPLPVFFNGKPLDRPYAENALACTDTPVGKVHLHGYRSGATAIDTLLVLQGFPVNETTAWDGEPLDVVHLDSRVFIARLPDRTQLIDAEEQCQRVSAAIKALWRSVLERRKAELPAADFVDRFLRIAQRSGHVDLFDDVPLLPRQVCEEIVGYPIQEGYDARDYLRGLAAHIDRAAAERGEIRLAELDSTDAENIGYWMYARARGYVLVHSLGLSEHHWVHPLVRTLQDEPLRVEIIGETHRAAFDARFIWPAVVLCERYAIVVGTDRVELRDEALFYDDQIVVPAGEHSADAVRQASSYIDGDDRFCEDDLQADRAALARLIGHLRGGDPTATLQSLLGDLPLENYPLLAKKRFHITIGAARGEHAVEPID
jgi:hypothetical protein